MNSECRRHAALLHIQSREIVPCFLNLHHRRNNALRYQTNGLPEPPSARDARACRDGSDRASSGRPISSWGEAPCGWRVRSAMARQSPCEGADLKLICHVAGPVLWWFSSRLAKAEKLIGRPTGLQVLEAVHRPHEMVASLAACSWAFHANHPSSPSP